jgi:antitoxin ParD1/3/4
MVQMNVSVPEGLKTWCELQVADGRYATASDYVRDLIRQDQDRRSGIAKLQAAIDEGLRSGISPQTLQEILADARKHAH